MGRLLRQTQPGPTVFRPLLECNPSFLFLFELLPLLSGFRVAYTSLPETVRSDPVRFNPTHIMHLRFACLFSHLVCPSTDRCAWRCVFLVRHCVQ